MTFEEQLSRWFHGHEGAVHFALALYDAIQKWDDVYDGDLKDAVHADEVFGWLAFGKELHPFFAEYAHLLRPAFLGVWLKWMAANELEKGQPSGDDLDRSFMLRAGYYDLLHLMAWMIGGTAWAREVGPEIYRGYGETRASLGAEFGEKEVA